MKILFLLIGIAAGLACASPKYTTTASTSTKRASTKASTKASSTVSLTSTSTGKVKYAGVNIAGFDFGCTSNGTCPVTSVTAPGKKAVAQMQHFVNDDGLNAFRLPVAWQYLVNAKLGDTLDSTHFAAYDSLVTSCLEVAELCIVSIHNYARWNGAVIGQSAGAVSNKHFTSLWSQLATKYAGKPKVAFGIMNEPHGLNVSIWAETVQQAVTAIRKAGATKNLILLPGADYQSAGAFLYDGSATYLKKVANLDGTTHNLAFDVHAYLDDDLSGTHATCTTSNVQIFDKLATWLRAEGRQAFLTETGGGSTTSCIRDVCEELRVLMANSDVYLGWTGWAAGSFSTSYVLSETPFEKSGIYTDQKLVTKCIAGVFNSS